MNAFIREETQRVQGNYCEDSDEDDRHPNTMMLQGPVGSGKTALVFACAAQLGFEVIEINASQVICSCFLVLACNKLVYTSYYLFLDSCFRSDQGQ